MSPPRHAAAELACLTNTGFYLKRSASAWQNTGVRGSRGATPVGGVFAFAGFLLFSLCNVGRFKSKSLPCVAVPAGDSALLCARRHRDLAVWKCTERGAEVTFPALGIDVRVPDGRPGSGARGSNRHPSLARRWPLPGRPAECPSAWHYQVNCPTACSACLAWTRGSRSRGRSRRLCDASGLRVASRLAATTLPAYTPPRGLGGGGASAPAARLDRAMWVEAEVFSRARAHACECGVY